MMNELRALPEALFQIFRVASMGLTMMAAFYLIVFGFWGMGNETFTSVQKRSVQIHTQMDWRVATAAAR